MFYSFTWLSTSTAQGLRSTALKIADLREAIKKGKPHFPLVLILSQTADILLMIVKKKDLVTINRLLKC